MKKSHLIAVFTTLIAVIHAEDCCMPEYLPGKPLCDDTACGIYSQYAGILLDCGWNVFTWGEFLYWRPIRSVAWAVLKVQETSDFGVPALGTIQKELALKFGYRPAFRVGIGMALPCFDNWQLIADYTWYHHNFTKTFTTSEPSFLASTTVASTPLVLPIYSAIKNTTTFDYDIVGINVQRPNYLGQRVILSPFFGIKWMHRVGKIKQEAFRVNTVDTARAFIHYDSFGLSGGFDGSWLLCWNLRLIGKADVGLLYAYHSKFSQRVAFNLLGSDQVVKQGQLDEHFDILAKGGMGLGWGTYFCCNRYHADLALTYDFMGDIQKMTLNTGMIENGSAMLVGLTLRGQFDF